MRFVFSLSLVLLTACAVNESQIFVDAGPDIGAEDVGTLEDFERGPGAYFEVGAPSQCPVAQPPNPPAPLVRWLDTCVFPLTVLDEGNATDPASLYRRVLAPCDVFDVAGVFPSDWFLVLAFAPPNVETSCGRDIMFLAAELRPQVVARTFNLDEALNHIRQSDPPTPGPPTYSFDYQHDGFVPIATTEPLP